jgi:protein-disulfide isomerase
LQAHALCRVLPNTSYFKMVDVLLDQQENWVRSSDPVAKLKQYAKFAGISSQDYDAIMSDRAYLEAIVEMRQNATRDHKVQSTPTFVINGEKSFSGAMSFDEFLAELNAFGI